MPPLSGTCSLKKNQAAAVLFILLFIPSGLFASAKNSPYDYLLSIKSPGELLFSLLPHNYCAKVSLGGSIADEMNTALKNLNPETPEYSESFNGSDFELLVSNESYPEQTRNLLSGIMNPLEMIDIIIISLINQQSPAKFSELKSQTNARIIKTTADNSLITIHLSPKKQRFSYSYNDNGSYIQESFFTDMKITLDTSYSLVHDILIRKRFRQFTSDATAEPAFDSSVIHYIFSYIDSVGSAPVPFRMEIITNNNQIIDLGVTYRREGRYVLFNRKSILCRNDSVSSELTVTYSDYSQTACKASKNSAEKVNRHLLAASVLSAKALELMRKGNIGASARTFREIAEKYSETPQAIEARRLLSQLPDDLR